MTLSPAHVEAARRVALLLAEAAKATSSGEDYDVIRADLVNRVEEAFMGFVSQAGAVTSFRNAAGRALAEDIPAAFGRCYADAAGEGAEPEPDDDAWVTSKQAEQIDFMAAAFESLKEWRASENFTESDIQARAELWGGMLDGLCSEAHLRGMKNMLLEFLGDDGDESCETCQELKNGPPHTAKWVREHEMIPAPGNDNFICKGYRCQHYWVSVKTGEQVTL